MKGKNVKFLPEAIQVSPYVRETLHYHTRYKGEKDQYYHKRSKETIPFVFVTNNCGHNILNMCLPNIESYNNHKKCK